MITTDSALSEYLSKIKYTDKKKLSDRADRNKEAFISVKNP